MYPNPVKLFIAPGVSLCIDDGDLITDDVSTIVELESYAGSGCLEITFEGGGRKVGIMMSPDQALTVVDTLASTRMPASGLTRSNLG